MPIELLSPAGDGERLNAALQYGADAVYLGGSRFGMRAAQGCFDGAELTRAVGLCHARGARLYLTVNTLPHNSELATLPDFLRQAGAAGVDALIVSDLGVLAAARRILPDMELHVSTQAGIVNYAAAAAFYELGAKRAVLARELSLAEIAEIREKAPAGLELEVFVHGAMCMSVSGRCLLSDYLTGRDANRGECAQPCRWSYHLVEEKRPGQYFPIGEEEGGSYILNAKDLCMLPYLHRLAEAGITSFKIEGRAKSSYYTAVVTNAYRIALNDYESRGCPWDWAPPDWLFGELEKVSHRRYSTGFYFGTPNQYPESGGYIREWDIVAIVTGWAAGRLLLTQRNKFSEGDMAELLEPGERPRPLRLTELRDGSGALIPAAPHPEMELSVACEMSFPPGSILRLPRDRGE